MAAREEQRCTRWKPAMSEAASAPLPHLGLMMRVRPFPASFVTGPGGRHKFRLKFGARAAELRHKEGQGEGHDTGIAHPSTPCPWWRRSGCGRKECVLRTGRSGGLPWMPSRPSRTPRPKSALTSDASSFSWGSWRRRSR